MLGILILVATVAGLGTWLFRLHVYPGDRALHHAREEAEARMAAEAEASRRDLAAQAKATTPPEPVGPLIAGMPAARAAVASLLEELAERERAWRRRGWPHTVHFAGNALAALADETPDAPSARAWLDALVTEYERLREEKRGDPTDEDGAESGAFGTVLRELWSLQARAADETIPVPPPGALPS